MKPTSNILKFWTPANTLKAMIALTESTTRPSAKKFKAIIDSSLGKLMILKNYTVKEITIPRDIQNFNFIQGLKQKHPTLQQLADIVPHQLTEKDVVAWQKWAKTSHINISKLVKERGRKIPFTFQANDIITVARKETMDGRQYLKNLLAVEKKTASGAEFALSMVEENLKIDLNALNEDVILGDSSFRNVFVSPNKRIVRGDLDSIRKLNKDGKIVDLDGTTRRYGCPATPRAISPHKFRAKNKLIGGNKDIDEQALVYLHGRNVAQVIHSLETSFPLKKSVIGDSGLEGLALGRKTHFWFYRGKLERELLANLKKTGHKLNAQMAQDKIAKLVFDTLSKDSRNELPKTMDVLKGYNGYADIFNNTKPVNFKSGVIKAYYWLHAEGAYGARSWARIKGWFEGRIQLLGKNLTPRNQAFIQAYRYVIQMMDPKTKITLKQASVQIGKIKSDILKTF